MYINTILVLLGIAAKVAAPKGHFTIPNTKVTYLTIGRLTALQLMDS